MPNMAGRGWRGLLGAALVGAAALGLAGPARADPFRLIITDLTTPLVPGSVLDLAARNGYFAREGVDVQVIRVQQTPSALAALIAGEGDMADVATDAALTLIARGMLKAKVVASASRSLAYMVVGKSDIARLADLGGRSFGVGRIGSADQSLTAKVLAAGNLAPDAVNFVALGQPATRVQALRAGQIDATTVSIGTWTAMPDKTGLHVIMPPAAFYAAAPVLTKIDLVPDMVLAKRRPEVLAVVRALVKASRDYAADAKAWVDAVAAVRTDLRRQDLEALTPAFKGEWSVNGGLDRHDLQTTEDWLFQGADLAALPKPPLASWSDLTVLRDVVTSLGPADGAPAPALN